MRLLPFLFLALLLSACAADSPPADAQTPSPTAPDREPPPLVVMNLAAHPDDEDGATMAYYRYAKDARVYSVIFTRGEGGQNEIGPELYQALGAIRTRETEQAARTLGTQVYFLNFYDFGYSKIAREAFEKWGGRDHVTARLVRLIRKVKPDVLFTNHDTVTVGPRRQHGQHQAVGLAGYDAFTLAADPTYHPEQLDEDGVDLWQPKRFFLRHFRGAEVYDVGIPVGEIYEPAGQSHAALAADALGFHASQGMDMFAQRIRGRSVNQFSLLRSATEAPLNDGDLAGNLPPNTTARPSLSYLIDSGRVPSFPDDLLSLNDRIAVPGQHVQLRWNVERLPERRLRWELHGAIDTTLYLSDTTPGLATLHLPPDAVPTLPKKVYQYERLTNHPPVIYAAYRAGTDELLAAGYLPLDIAPPLYVEADTEVMRLRPGENQLPVRAQVFDPAAERLELNVAVSRDADRTVVWHQQMPLLFNDDGQAAETLTLTLPPTLSTGDYTLSLTGLAQPATHQPLPARAQVTGRVFEVEVPEVLKVGVVASYDNTLEQALQELGTDYVLLDSLALAHAAFDGLHTIVIDIRSYLIRHDLRTHNDKLLAWVRDGGHLIVNYQKTFEWNERYPDPFDRNRNNPGTFAPYPIVLSHDRVTREDAAVEAQYPDHPLLHRPNEITTETWADWVQERGLYFPSSWDDAYNELFCLHDPGEAPLCGSTLLAHYGEGTYLYSALVWYRQLKVYHPGAYAMFANMISLPLTDDRAPTSSRE
ncbi:MAG: PIG-L deacetylase family protein [Rhodothermales bacterium]